MLSVVIQALKKSVMFLCTPFANRRLIYGDGLLKKKKVKGMFIVEGALS